MPACFPRVSTLYGCNGLAIRCRPACGQRDAKPADVIAPGIAPGMAGHEAHQCADLHTGAQTARRYDPPVPLKLYDPPPAVSVEEAVAEFWRSFEERARTSETMEAFSLDLQVLPLDRAEVRAAFERVRQWG
jgi:hypothetical protein